MIGRRRKKSTFTHRPRAGFQPLRWIVLMLAAAIVVWVCGLILFVGRLPNAAASPEAPTDAIVVLTGGSGRLEAGLDLMQAGWARALFVSGVYETVDVRLLLDVFQRQVPEIACCIELGYTAGNTRGNAAETNEWVRANQMSSVRLVTSTYHMPRAMLEFRRTLGDITLVAHPVAPVTHRLEEWWYRPRTFRLVAWEYTKYLLAAFGIAVRTAAG